MSYLEVLYKTQFTYYNQIDNLASNILPDKHFGMVIVKEWTPWSLDGVADLFSFPDIWSKKGASNFYIRGKVWTFCGLQLCKSFSSLFPPWSKYRAAPLQTQTKNNFILFVMLFKFF